MPKHNIYIHIQAEKNIAVNISLSFMKKGRMTQKVKPRAKNHEELFSGMSPNKGTINSTWLDFRIAMNQ